jgi:hypothetical protein
VWCPSPCAVAGADLVYIKAANTVSGRTEINVITAASGFEEWGTQTPLAITNPGLSLSHIWTTESDFMYLVNSGNDLYILKYQGNKNLGSGSGLELHCLSAESKYQTFAQSRYGIPTPYPDRPTTKFNTKFALGRNDDLYIFTTSGDTTTGQPELQVLSSTSGYQIWADIGQSGQTKVGLASGNEGSAIAHIWYTASSFQFLVGADNDVFVVKYQGDGGTVEVHILSDANNYQTWSHNFETTALSPRPAQTS